MDEDEPAIVSGDIETIVIKPDSIEVLFDIEDSFWSEEDSDPDITNSNLDESCFVTASGEVVTINNEDIVQTPFYLESYFMDNDGFRSRTNTSYQQQKVVEIDRVTCYDCDIVFCNEHRLLEHLMTHIDVYRMGCDVCDKDLNLDEKFQLHMMAVTWQSIYYCDFCRKSCAGVVRSKSQPPPPGKTYMCHDCEYRTKQENTNFQSIVCLYENVDRSAFAPVEPVQQFIPPPLPPPLPLQVKPPAVQPAVIRAPSPPPVSPSVPPPVPPPVLPPVPPTVPPTVPPSVPLSVPPPIPQPPPPAEVLQDHKQKPNNEVKFEECTLYSTENTTQEVQDCFATRKSPPKKENKRGRKPKPKVQVVSESMKQALKMSTRSHTREKNKMIRSYKCRYCPIAFTHHYTLMTHLREKHKFHKLRYVCKLCGKDFMQQRCYENHISFHQLAKNHMCFVCNLAFLSKFELEQHARMHDKSEIINTYCDSPESVALDLRKKKSKSAA